MRLITCLYFLITFVYFTYPQDKESTDLETRKAFITKNKIDSLNIRASILIDKGKYLSANKVLKALEEITNKDSLSQKINIYYDIGYNFQNARVLDSSAYYYKKGDLLFNDNIEDKLWSKRYLKWGSLYFTKSQPDSSMINLLKALDYAEKSNDDYQLFNVKSNIGEVFLSHKSFEKASEYFQKCLTHAENLNDSLLISFSRMYLGRLYYEEKKYEQSENYLKEALNYFVPNNINRSILVSKGYLSKIYVETGRMDEAVLIGYQLIPLLKQMEFKNDAESLAKNALQLSEIAQKDTIEDDDILKADSLIKSNLKITKEPSVVTEQTKALLKEAEVNDNSVPKNMVKVLEKENLSEMLNKALKIKDSTYQHSLNSKYDELEIKYQTEKKEKQLLQLRNENIKKELKILEESNKNLWLSLLVAFFVIVLFLVVFYAINRKRKLIWQNKLAIAKAIQDEHNQIGIDLHDTKAKELEILAINLKAKGEFKISKKLDNIRADLRKLSHDLSKIPFADSEFDEQLINTASSYHNDKFKIEINGLKDFEWEHIDNTIKRNLFIVVREAISNAYRHSKASKMSISFEKSKNKLQLVMTDNGTGFQDINTSKGRGFKNIKIRVNEINGEVSFKSIKNKGTNISIILAIA